MKDNNYNNPNPKSAAVAALLWNRYFDYLDFNLVIMPAFLSRQVRTTTYFDLLIL